MFYIRADANSELGSGHVMRCLTIANALRKKGQEVTFITADYHAEKMIRDNHYSFLCLETDWNDMEMEISALKKIILEKEIRSILIDSYYVTKKYFDEIKKMVKIIYLDDLNQFIYPADILINYNIFAKKLPYTSLYPENTKLLLGCRYVPLRDEFTGKKKRYSPQAMDILITTGGADPYRIAEQLIMNIHRSKELKEINLHVVAGPLSKNTSELLCMAEEDPKVKLYQNVTNMAELMINCDVAVSAGGSTLYELCSCGIPAVSFSYADNQLAAVKEFHEQGMIFYAGDMREDPNGCLDTLIRELRELCRDEHKREKLSRRMKELVDGSGACRIADQLLIL